MADSTLRVHPQYHSNRYHVHLHKPAADYAVETLYAYQLGPLTAAVAAHGVSNVWEGVPVIPLTDVDEIHSIWVTPFNFDSKAPFYVRWGLLSNADSKALAIATTVDFVDTGATMTGSDTAGDGATALTETITAITTTSNPGTSKPFFSVWGKINGRTTDFDILFLKLVASGQTTADAVRVFCLQLAYRQLAA